MSAALAHPLPDGLAAESQSFESLTARERLAWAVERYGDTLLFTSSFGVGSAVLLHLWSELAPTLPVHFIDTGFLFDETLTYRDEMVKRLGLRVEVLRPAVAREDFLAKHGLRVYQTNPDFCCAQNKVEPLERLALPGKRAWISGVRRDESPSRADTPILQEMATGIVKVHPIADWSARDVWRYQTEHGLPEHPLFEKAYASVGCVPCTRAISADEDERAGRWSGSQKVECGLHTFLKAK